jgi:hypothetical protein
MITTWQRKIEMADLPEKIWILAFRARKYSDEEWPDWSFVSDPSVCLEFPSGREVDSPYFQCLAVEYKRDPVRIDAKAAFGATTLAGILE